VLSAQGEDRYGQGIALPAEAVRVVQRKGAIPFEATAGVAGLGEGAGIDFHFLDRERSVVEGAIEEEGRDGTPCRRTSGGPPPPTTA
jgi:hypothetical protein